jgi:hypothetical protein
MIAGTVLTGVILGGESENNNIKKDLKWFKPHPAWNR